MTFQLRLRRESFVSAGRRSLPSAQSDADSRTFLSPVPPRQLLPRMSQVRPAPVPRPSALLKGKITVSATDAIMMRIVADVISLPSVSKLHRANSVSRRH
jgi:hypothetical protein